MKFNKEKIIIVAIFVIAIFSRIYLWPNTIDDINCDETMTAINAKAIAETGKDMYGTSFPVYFETWLNGGQSALLTYFIALCIKVFGFSIFSIRFPMLSISIFSLFVFYKFMNTVFQNKKITVITLFILAINPWHIMQSIWSLDCNLFPHFMLISIYLLVKGIKQVKMKYVYLSMVFFGITTYTYGVSLYFIPIFLVIYIIFLLKNKKINLKEVIISAVIVIFISLPLIIMTILNLFNLQDVKIGCITIQNFKYFTRTRDMILFSNNLPGQLVDNIKTLLEILLLNYDGLEWNAIYNIGTIYLGSIIFAIIGLVGLLRNKEINMIGKSAVITWIISSLLIGILVNNVNINRLNIIWYPIIILIGFGLHKIWEVFNFNKKMIAIIIIIYSLSFTLFNINFYKNHVYKIKNSNTWSKGLKDAVEYSISSGKNIIIDNQVLDTDKNIIFGIYLSNYNFKEYGFLNKNMLIENYLNYGNNIAMEAITKNKKIEFKYYDDTILDNYIYIIYKSNHKQLINNAKYEIKEFNNYYAIAKK